MKYEFASKQWLAALHGLIVGRAGAMGAIDPYLSYSLCEVYTGTPTHISPTGKLAWHYRVRGTEVEFHETESDDVDFKVVCDYQSILPAGRFDTKGDPERLSEMAAMGNKLEKDGKLERFGDPAKRPGSFRSLHDAIARMTL